VTPGGKNQENRGPPSTSIIPQGCQLLAAHSRTHLGFGGRCTAGVARKFPFSNHEKENYHSDDDGNIRYLIDVFHLI
jgi:hypothetical protein